MSYRSLEQLKSSILEIRRGTGVSGNRSPHKLIMLLAVVDLYENGLLRENQIVFNRTLERTFRRLFGGLAATDEWCQPAPTLLSLANVQLLAADALAGTRRASCFIGNLWRRH